MELLVYYIKSILILCSTLDVACFPVKVRSKSDPKRDRALLASHTLKNLLTLCERRKYSGEVYNRFQLGSVHKLGSKVRYKAC